MPSFRRSVVDEVLAERRGLQRVLLSGGDRAYVLTELIGTVARGDEVIVNTTAVELGLGTGGWHVVHWNLARNTWNRPGDGHIMKLRYTSLQTDTGSALENRTLGVSDLGGRSVVVCGLHSQIGVVAAVVGHVAPGTRVAYVMTDGAALPLALSDMVAQLSDAGLIGVTITAGHAFGGDLEAVSIPSALLLAADEGADVTIVGMGPGVVGTGTSLGTTAVEVASISDTVDALGGRAIVVVRASDGDPRPRHRGLSHHTVTALELLRTRPSVFLPSGHGDLLSGGDATSADVFEVEIPVVADVLAGAGVEVTTMGRGPGEDPLFFAVAAAAGVGAARQ